MRAETLRGQKRPGHLQLDIPINRRTNARSFRPVPYQPERGRRERESVHRANFEDGLQINSVAPAPHHPDETENADPDP